MEPEKSTKLSSAFCAKAEPGLPSIELDLPTDNGFRSMPPRLSLAEFVRRNRELRRIFMAGLPTEEERLKRKCTVEFCI
jgi:hypothetical protein